MKLPKPKLSIPKLKLPFGKGKGDAGGLGPGSFEPNDDYLKPTFFQRHAQWLAIGAAYVATFCVFGGIAAYLMLNEVSIMAELEAERPVFEVKHAADDTAPPRQQSAEPAPSAAEPEVAEDGVGDTMSGGDTPASGDTREEIAEAPAAAPEPDDFAELLAPHPDPTLIEESDVGPLPKIAEDGRTPWQVYSRPASSLESRPRIAVVVTNLGTRKETTEQALRMPGPVTLTFAPYARKLGEWIDKARADGHEVMITLPMEPRDFPRSDAGPYALLTTLTPEQNMRRLEWVLSRATGYIGVTNYQGSGFAAKQSAVSPIMSAIARRGLIYFDTSMNADSDALEAAKSAGGVGAEADIVADSDLNRRAISRKLAEAEVVAKSNNTAIVLIDSYPVGIDRVTRWIEELKDKGIVITPLSAILAARAKQESG